MLALKQHRGSDLDKSEILNMPIPVSYEEIAEWNNIVQSHQKTVLEEAMLQELRALDQVVGKALGLDISDITEIQRDMVEDTFLAGIEPRYPGTVTRKQGFRTGLDSSE